MTSAVTTARYFSRSTLSFCDLGRVRVVDDGRDDLGRPPDPEDAVRPFDDGRRLVRRGGEDGLLERLVECPALGQDPAEVARLGRRRRVGGRGLGHVVPRLPALDVRERGLRLGPGRRLRGVARREIAELDDRLDLDDPGVARLGDGGLHGEPGVDLLGGDRADPLLGRELGLDPAVDDPLERDRGEVLPLLLDDLLLRRALGVGQVPGQDGRVDPAGTLVEPPLLDEHPILEFVLGDRLAVDAADRGQVLVVVGQRDGDAEDDDRQEDDQAEPEVEIEVPSVLGFPRGSVGALDDGLGTKGHGGGRFLSHGRLTPGMEGRGMVHRPSKGQCPSPIVDLPPGSVTEGSGRP